MSRSRAREYRIQLQYELINWTLSEAMKTQSMEYEEMKLRAQSWDGKLSQFLPCDDVTG